MSTILVTGATGVVGSHVVHEILQRGEPARALVRDADRARSVLEGDVELAVGDFAEPHTLDAALDGVAQVFLACANHPRQAEYEMNLIDSASRAGVRRIVKLSALGASVGSPLAFWDAHGRIEEHLARTEITAVVLRPTFYMSNLLASAAAVRHTGQLFLPAGGAAVAMVCPLDVAAAAAAALEGDAVVAGTYRLTGPEAITFATVADELAEAVGSPVRFIDVPEDAARASMVDSSIPPWIVDNLITLFGFLRRGAQEEVGDDVLALSGRHPRSFASFARDHAAAFRV